MTIRLTHWRIVRHACGTNHLNGRVENTTRGRISSPVVKFDAARRLATTWSGNTYKLVGPPANSDQAADYFLDHWLRQQRATSADITFIPMEDL